MLVLLLFFGCGGGSGGGKFKSPMAIRDLRGKVKGLPGFATASLHTGASVQTFMLAKNMGEARKISTSIKAAGGDAERSFVTGKRIKQRSEFNEGEKAIHKTLYFESK